MRWAVLRAVAVTAGRVVVLRTFALGSGLAIVVAVLFGSGGLRAVDVVRWMHQSIGPRAALWATWVVLATPVVAGAFDAPGTLTLRTLVSRRQLVAHVLPFLVLAQLPWAALFAGGSGVVAAANAALLAVAVETSILAATRRPRHLLLLAIATGVLVADLPAWSTLAPALGLAYASTTAAWRTVLVGRTSVLRLTRPTYPVVALVVTHLLGLARTAQARLTTAALMALVGGAALSLSMRNDPPTRPVARALLYLTLPLCVAISALVAPVLRVEARLLPFARATRTSSTVLFLSFALTLATPSSALGATSSAIAMSLADTPPWRVAASALVWTTLLAFTLAAWARRHQRTKRKSPATFSVGVVVVAAAFSWAASW